MSYYDEASLVVIPSGYKTSKVYAEKPTDGSGDLTFTRTGDTATRVNSAGLIERVRTNVILQSNTFNTTWLPTSATITSGATDPNGGTTAWTLANTAASGIIQQAATLTGLRSVSIYAKQGTHRYLYMGAYGTTDSYQVFDLQTGTISTGTKGLIEAIGGGWYRCTSFGTDGITGGVQIFPSNNSLGAGTTNGNILIWRCQYESGDIATDYIPTTTAAVSVGPVANVPRLDYLGSTCGKLLLEPQQTNLVTYSEQLGSQNLQNSPSITSNAAVSPDGYTNADKLTPTASGSYTGAFLTSIAAGTYTISMFAKADGKQWVFFYEIGSAGGNNGTWFNVANGTIGNVGAAWSNAKIENYGNGWYRVSATVTFAAGGNYLYWLAADADNSNVLSPNGSDGMLMWGLSYEVGTYATSYIPTLAASATRGADACSKTGISSLIGQTEGVVFMDFIAQTSTDTQSHFFLGNDKIGLYGGSTFTFYSDGGVSINGGSFVTGQRYKIAFAYKANDYVAYVNGVQKGTDTSATVPATSELYVNSFNGSAQIQKKELSQFLLFKTRLTNAELAELTTL